MKQVKIQETAKQLGFTLIELSIVLVIIGLIVGGVLVGQDLIRAAEIRATVGQYEKYNTAINTFMTKFNGKPGDLPYSQASSFGMWTFGGSAGNYGWGDGNGLVQDNGGDTLETTTAGRGEPIVFWRHLSDANLIDGNYGSGNTIATATGVTSGSTAPEAFLPAAKLGGGNYFVVYSANGLNYYQIVGVATVPASGTYTYQSTSLTPIEAFNIDNKVDDGAPITGVVVAKAINAINGVPSANVGSASNTCVVGTGTATTDTYNRSISSGGADKSCSVQLRFN